MGGREKVRQQQGSSGKVRTGEGNEGQVTRTEERGVVVGRHEGGWKSLRTSGGWKENSNDSKKMHGIFFMAKKSLLPCSISCGRAFPVSQEQHPDLNGTETGLPTAFPAAFQY